MDKFLYRQLRSWLVLLFIVVVPVTVFAQQDYAYPSNEAEFMAQANRLYQERDYKRYMDMLVVGVRRGYAEAEANMGAIYMSTPADSSGKNHYDLAVKLFERSANKGHSGAMYMLATCYRSGLGVTASMEMYRYWIKRAAKAGSIEAQRACEQENLGCY